MTLAVLADTLSMMRILLIDLATAPIDDLRVLLPKVEIKVITADALPNDTEGYNGIVVAGTYDGQPFNKDLASRLVEYGLPLLGIGAGFETICSQLGMDLSEVYERGTGAGKLVPTDDGTKLFQGTDPLLVAKNERWLVDEVPRGVQVLARSDSGIEAVRHKQRPLTALQQLPGDFTYVSDAKLVYANLFGLFGKI